MKSLFRISKLAKPYWRQSLLSLFLLTIVVVLDLFIPRLVQKIIDLGILKHDMQVITQTTWLMLGISLVNTLLAIGNNTYSVFVGESFGRDLREKLFSHIQDFSFGNLDRTRTGQLMVNLTSDVTFVQRVVQVFLRIGTRAPLLMIGSILLMFNTNARLAMVIFLLLVLTTLVIIIFSTRTTSMFFKVQNKLDKMNTTLQENIAGVRVVKAFVRGKKEIEKFGEANLEYTKHSILVTQVMSVLFPILTFMMNMGVILVVWSGGRDAIQGDLTVGEIVAFANYLLTTLGPLGILAQLSNVVASGIASAERIELVLLEEPDIPLVANNCQEQQITGRVEFIGVGFHYKGDSSQPVLEDITFSAEAGQTVAILGATGSGKSSLVNLIPRFYESSSGIVLLDGVDIRNFSKEMIQSNITVTLQDTILFTGSIRDNIRYGAPGSSEEEVIAVAKIAQAHDFILQLPNGYDTSVEQRGVNLSGGQKQRIAIARSLLPRPKILILDDSTSAIDVETENRIHSGLKDWSPECTIFMVAQRISTVLNADKIIILERGRISAQGTHRELMKSSSIYREIYRSQLGDKKSIPGENN